MIHTHIEESLHLPDPLTALRHPLAEKAREVAKADFIGVVRKIPKGWDLPPKPYFSHVEAVAITLALHGFDPEVISAGYLHDHIEDLPEKWSLVRVSHEFTPRVAELVDWVTQQDKVLDWDLRNERYLERIAQAPDDARAISCADKISNISDTNTFLRLGYPVRDQLKRGWRVNSEKFHRLHTLVKGRVPHALLAQFEDALKTFDELGKPLEE